jgi:hypothetical protein
MIAGDTAFVNRKYPIIRGDFTGSCKTATTPPYGPSNKRALIIDGKSPSICKPELAKILSRAPTANRKLGL